MQFIVSTGTLLKQLQSISGVVSSNTILPIVECFLFDIRKGELVLASTDLETSMITTIPVESKDACKVAIPAKQILEILKNLPEQPLTIKVEKENFGVEISSENGRYKLMGEDGDNFPKITQQEGSDEVKAASGVILRAITKTMNAIGNDEMRPAMNGLYFQMTPEGTHFVATDAHRLVKMTRTDMTFKNSTSFIVPRKSVAQLKMMLPNNDSEVSIAHEKGNAFFRTESMQLVCRLIDAKYPDYQAVIPVDNPSCLTIEKEELMGTLKRVQIFANKTTHQVAFKLAGSSLQISAQDLDFSNEAKETLTCEFNGDDMEIGFNSKFMLEMLNNVDTKQIRLELSTPTRAGVLTPDVQEENESLLMLVMPIMINNY